MDFEKEITVQITVSYEELDKILKEKGFKEIAKVKLHDRYLIRDDYDIKNNNTLDILEKAIILRQENDEKKLIHKHKKYGSNKEILEQYKISCEVEDIEKTYLFMKDIGFNDLIEIRNNSVVYKNDITEFIVQIVNDKYVFIEMEDKPHTIDKYYETINDIINEFKSYNLPILGDNYFVKKAEIILNEVLK